LSFYTTSNWIIRTTSYRSSWFKTNHI